ncbi:hypothetical protein LTR84_008093 [Exophiala bonariae]|uniref:3-beta hydroxysteroid dehydrogenase/isomerase domain-containing protein n=1 Tax=Exophiala bonariae TaxID=1690606 RepID=A0AAV9NQH4_9EURO|nr:hypothetical protein LTR84_008093 [Exophiala bonariae]
MALLSPITTILSSIVVYAIWWLYRLNRNITSIPPEALQLSGEPWTNDDIRNAWNKFERVEHDFTKYLPPKQNRRYVVFGGSGSSPNSSPHPSTEAPWTVLAHTTDCMTGLVGGWIVEHLILRGEDPRAIRIVDLAAPRREHAVKEHVTHIKADISDAASVDSVFSLPWPKEVADLPLTVFHTAAYIQSGHRSKTSLPIYLRVNIQGTRNVLDAAKAAGCDILIATSSASIALKAQTVFSFLPWRRYPDGFIQVHDNAEAEDYDAPLHRFAGSYAWSKARADKMVRDADDKKARFRTGTIRPGHTIYGHGDENENSLPTKYLIRGGLPTWLSNFALQLVSAQNVSLAHLLYESRIHSHDLGGQGYAISDAANPPIRYADLERFLELLAHPATPVRWRYVPPVPIMLLAYLNEVYVTLQHGYLSSILPRLSPDLELLQPAMFNCANMHVVYGGSRAREELGYRSTHTTLEGLYLIVKEWNDNVEAKIAAAKIPPL